MTPARLHLQRPTRPRSTAEALLVERAARALGAMVLMAVSACAGCTNPPPRPTVRLRNVPPAELAARVDREQISVGDVGAVARAERIPTAQAALDRAIVLTLLAQEAIRRRMDRDPLVVDTAWRAAVQELLSRTVEQAVRDEDLSVVDIEMGMRVRGFELSHGALYRTQHLVMRVARDAPADVRERARAAAANFRSRALALPAPRVGEPFERLANEVAGTLEHRVELLPPIDRTGRHARGEILPTYAAAASALSSPGDLSDVVETEYGFHVIALVETLPANERPDAEVRAAIRTELAARLRRRELDTLLDGLRRRHHVQIPAGAERAAESITIGGAEP